MDKQHAHQLLDQLDPSQLNAVVHLLEVMVDPQTASIRNAPVDDEPVTEKRSAPWRPLKSGSKKSGHPVRRSSRGDGPHDEID